MRRTQKPGLRGFPEVGPRGTAARASLAQKGSNGAAPKRRGRPARAEPASLAPAGRLRGRSARATTLSPPAAPTWAALGPRVATQLPALEAEDLPPPLRCRARRARVPSPRSAGRPGDPDGHRDSPPQATGPGEGHRRGPGCACACQGAVPAPATRGAVSLKLFLKI